MILLCKGNGADISTTCIAKMLTDFWGILAACSYSSVVWWKTVFGKKETQIQILKPRDTLIFTMYGHAFLI
jgi:hypothetical protein